jgi:long-chain acyl-CoA synthetase
MLSVHAIDAIITRLHDAHESRSVSTIELALNRRPVPVSLNEPRHVGVFAQLTPDRPAIIMADGSRTISFAEYEAISNQCAWLLRECGLVRGDNAAVFMENHPLYLPLVWGAMRAGLRLTTIATHLGPEEIDYILSDCEAKVVFVSAGKAPILNACRRAGLDNSRCFVADGSHAPFENLEQALAAVPSMPISDQSEGVEMLYSSGTTGRPKGVKKTLPETPFGYPAPGVYASMARFGFDENARYLSPAPLYHAAPLMFNIRAARFGGTSIVMPRFDAEYALALIEEHQVTHSQWVPTMFVRMLKLDDSTRAQHDLSSHKVAIHAAAPCPVEIKKAMIDWWGPILDEYYGGSEGNGITSLSSAEWLSHPGSVGRAMIGEVKICSDDGDELPTGNIGGVYFAGGPVFEYHNDPEKTASTRTPSGWSTIGDMGYVDDEGYLYLTDRKAFVIISGGVNIYPQEAENLLVTHPSVLDAAVFGVPNEEFGEEVKAVVQTTTAMSESPELAEELIAFCRAQLSSVKCPRTVDFIDVMPREANGKLYKRRLRDPYWTSA